MSESDIIGIRSDIRSLVLSIIKVTRICLGIMVSMKMEMHSLTEMSIYLMSIFSTTGDLPQAATSSLYGKIRFSTMIRSIKETISPTLEDFLIHYRPIVFQ